MSENYPQKFLNELYEEGDRDYHFFTEILGFVENLYPEPYMKNRVPLNKSVDKKLRDALLLSDFLMTSGDYVGFYMKEYEKDVVTFHEFQYFQQFIISSIKSDPDYLTKILTEDRYTIGLKKINVGAKAPLVTREIESIFKSD